MNNILELKGQMRSNSANKPGPVTIPAGKIVSSDRMKKLKQSLVDINEQWKSFDLSFSPLISVTYNCVVAKSNRLRKLLISSNELESKIVGARFIGDQYNPQHVITYNVSEKVIKSSIEWLDKCIQIVETRFNGSVDSVKLKSIYKNWNEDKEKISKTAFSLVIHDCLYVDNFEVLTKHEKVDKSVIATFYDVGYDDLSSFLKELGLNVNKEYIIGNSVLLTHEQYNEFVEKYPFLVSMTVEDISKLDYSDFTNDAKVQEIRKLPSPSNEPVIGVIDTLYSNDVYFDEWVSYSEELPKGLKAEPNDAIHGTAVDSIIIDGPFLNKNLEDGCGHFRVRHFGVAKAGRFSSYHIMKKIERIVSDNRDIKVWNLSLGSEIEVSNNYISPAASLIDDLQCKYDDIIFVIAGTNKPQGGSQIRLGSPADSINSVVVNSINAEGNPATYSRKGPVLSFFKKPDICYYGGDEDLPVRVYTGIGYCFMSGTSFSAPWISRKFAYLMQVLNLPREVAKALIIDSASAWNGDSNEFKGYGAVPININDIIHSEDDEIRFYIYNEVVEHENYTHDIPVPVSKEKHPYLAKATLCYFPKCNRDQGVDYTNTELGLYFGRINDKGELKAIDKNTQGDEGAMMYEADARRFYRKWDNVKQIKEIMKNGVRGRKAYSNKMWGLKLRSTERFAGNSGKGMKYAVVITLKEIYGINRIEDFIKNCSLRGWIVNDIKVHERVNVHNISQTEIIFDE